jgi:predicted dehydrogenase
MVELINDPSIDSIYIPLHYEYALASLRAGKHVLLEKPSVSNASEARFLFDFHKSLSSKAPVLLEAFHPLFHPAFQLFSPISIERI